MRHDARHTCTRLVLLLLFLPQVAAFTSTVYFRQESDGPIVSLDSRDGTMMRLNGSNTMARLVGLALYSPTNSPRRLVWSDHRAIRSRAASDTSPVRTEIGAIVRARWFGVNFGATRADLLDLSIKGTRCVSVLQWSPTFVECLVAIPDRFPIPQSTVTPFVTESDCRITTTRGSMVGFVRNAAEMRASGYPSPIVERMELETTKVLPHALAIDSDSSMLYWSNSADGRIYRSSLIDTAIEMVQDNAWGVRGLAVVAWPQRDSDVARNEMYFTLETKGELRRCTVATTTITTTSSTSPCVVVLSGLDSPRGVAVDPTRRYLYWTEKTGRISRLDLSARSPTPQRVLTMTSITRLDGLVVDDKYLYWCETNTNVVARSSTTSFERQVLVGGSPNSILSWPRSIVLGSTDGDSNEQQQDLFYTEYTGRISKGWTTPSVLVNELTTSTMRFVDELLQQGAGMARGSGSHLHMYALE